MKNESLPQVKRSLRDYIKIFFCGTIMGAADVVPGVSGGTMAFILGIYNELLSSIKNILSPETVKIASRLQFRKMFQTLPWPFLLSLGLGIMASIIVFSTPIKWMLENRLALILAFFFGLVLGSAVTVVKQVSRWSIDRIISLLIGTAAGFLIVGLPMLAQPPSGMWYIVICGAVAVCAMILPGISGSFILLLMGKYDFVLNAVHELKAGVNPAANLTVLLLFCCGIVLGITFFVRLLSWMLKKFHDITVAILIGFMLGSLRKVWPWKTGDVITGDNIMPALNSDLIWAVLLAVAGFILVVLIEYIAKRAGEKN